MIYLQQCVASWVVIYFIPIVFIGAFFLLNLTLAVIKSKFTEEHKNKKSFKKKKKAITKKRGIDDTSDEEEDQDVEDPETKEINDLEKKFLDAIQKNEELSPEKKKAIKEKFRVEEFLKKVDLAVRQREI